MTKEREGFIAGVDRAIKIALKHKEAHHIVEIILRELKDLKKNEIKKIPY